MPLPVGFMGSKTLGNQVMGEPYTLNLNLSEVLHPELRTFASQSIAPSLLPHVYSGFEALATVPRP